VLIALRIPRKLWALFVVPLLSAYTLGTGGEPSAVRACIMGIVYVLGPTLGRKADAPSALALSAVLILAWSPSQLFEAGFVCSFAVVIGLIVLCPLFDRPLRKLCEPDPLRQQAESRRVVFLRWLGRQASALLALNLAAWIASTPLTAYYFGRFTPISLVSNFLVIPVSALALVAGCLSMLLGPCVSLAADVFNHANLFLMSVLVGSMQALLKIPGGSILIAPWPLWAVALWYVGVAAGVLWLRGGVIREYRSSVAGDGDPPSGVEC